MSLFTYGLFGNTIFFILITLFPPLFFLSFLHFFYFSSFLYWGVPFSQQHGLQETFRELFDFPFLFTKPSTEHFVLSWLLTQPQIKRIMGNGLRKVIFSSCFFKRKVRIKGCSKEVCALTKKAIKEVYVKFVHTLSRLHKIISWDHII